MPLDAVWKKVPATVNTKYEEIATNFGGHFWYTNLIMRASERASERPKNPKNVRPLEQRKLLYVGKYVSILGNTTEYAVKGIGLDFGNFSKKS